MEPPEVWLIRRRDPAKTIRLLSNKLSLEMALRMTAQQEVARLRGIIVRAVADPMPNRKGTELWSEAQAIKKETT